MQPEAELTDRDAGWLDKDLDRPTMTTSMQGPGPQYFHLLELIHRTTSSGSSDREHRQEHEYV